MNNSHHNGTSDHEGKQLMTPNEPVYLRSETKSREAAIAILRDKVEAIYDRETPAQQVADEAQPEKHHSFNWQQYHNAWQQYYQQYYQRYYLWQYRNLQQQVDKVRQGPVKAVQAVSTKPSNKRKDEIDRALRQRDIKAALLTKVKQRAHNIRHGYYFMPFVTAVTVGILVLFLQYNRVMIAYAQAYISPGSTVSASDIVLVDPSTSPNVGPEPRLIIPKIDVDTEVFYNITTLDTGPIEAALNNGIVHYNLPGANSLPGQVGNAVFLGHSSNDIFDPGNSKFVFVLLDRLNEGDIFYINYQGIRYIYRVTQKQIIKPTDVAALQIKTNKPLATLVTCTPIGTDLNRLLVTGEQISPDPSLASKPATQPSASNQQITVPGNSPTVIDRILNAF